VFLTVIVLLASAWQDPEFEGPLPWVVLGYWKLSTHPVVAALVMTKSGFAMRTTGAHCAAYTFGTSVQQVAS
jgi:hypothetical protein